MSARVTAARLVDKCGQSGRRGEARASWATSWQIPALWRSLLPGCDLCLQLCNVGLDPMEGLQNLAALALPVNLHEVGGDRRGEYGEEADPGKHQDHRDDASGNCVRIEVAVAHRCDGDDCPPDAIPERCEVMCIYGRLH